MMPLEAAACGTATLGLAKGGTLETVLPGQTGELLETVNIPNLISALESWDENKYNQKDLLAHSANFTKDEFKRKLSVIIEQCMRKSNDA